MAVHYYTAQARRRHEGLFVSCRAALQAEREAQHGHDDNFLCHASVMAW
jgi:hypothetical protein